MTYRFFKLAAFDIPQEDWLRVANHEVFGHGGRLRERFDGPVYYSIPAPPPYGRGGGATFFGFEREPTLHELMAISAAGMEANAVAAHRLAFSAMDRGSLHLRDAVRYLLFQLDTIDYILDARDGLMAPGHDVGDFLEIHNELAALRGDEPLTAKTLRRRVLLSFANPMLGEVVYGIVKDYIWRGEPRTRVRALNLGGVRYLPLVRFQLTPFGTEWVVDNLLQRNQRTFNGGVRAGGGPGIRAWGLHLETSRFATLKMWEIGGVLDVWRQPELALDDEPLGAAGWGAGVRAQITRPIGSLRLATIPAAITVEAGIKTSGYIPGEKLGAGPLARVGVSLGY
jgi:hypothetical protein